MRKLKALLILTVLLFTVAFSESKISGKVFFNYSSDLNKKGFNAFNMKRAYLTLDNAISESISYKVTYDMGKNDIGSAHTAFLKVAMVKWKTTLGDVSIGMQGMNMFKTMENTWGHRFIDKMPMDVYKFSSSADLGIGLSKTFGSISSSALITNGGGYKKEELDSHKKLSVHVVYGELKLNNSDGFNGGISLSTEPYDKDSLNTENTNVVGIFAGYAGNGFRGGFEFDTKKQENISGQIFSIYSTYKINNKLSVLARLDQADEDISDNNNGVQALITGFHYNAAKGLSIAPTIRFKDTEGSIILNFEFIF